MSDRTETRDRRPVGRASRFTRIVATGLAVILAHGAPAFPTLAAKKEAFVRIFAKMSRIVGHDNAMRVFTEGNYLSDGQPDPSRKKMRPEMITRLVTRKLAVA